MNKKATYLTGEEIKEGDSVFIGDWEGTVEQIVTEGCQNWEDFWKNETGEGVMLIGPKFGRMFNDFQDEDLIFVKRKE